nr:sulfite exporter TauE/SafE family protein [Allomuricauda sp.]
MLLLSAIVFGFLGSLHCLGMCGPIAFLLPLDREHKAKMWVQLFTYHFGRLLAYAIIGLLFGVLGKGLSIFGLQQKLSIAVGVLMVVLVLFPTRYFNGSRLLAPLYGVIGRVKSKLGLELKKKSNDTFLTIGFLNGFLPCGLVYMALLGAVAMGNPWQGGLYMMLFGVGTIPLMSAVVFSKGFLNGPYRSKIRKVIPVFVALVGLLFILRGLGLGIPYVSPKPAQNNMVSTNIECHQP